MCMTQFSCLRAYFTKSSCPWMTWAFMENQNLVTGTTSTFLHGLTWNITNTLIISWGCAWRNLHVFNSISPRVTCPWLSLAFVPSSKSCDTNFSIFLHGLTSNFTNVFTMICTYVWPNFHVFALISPRVICLWITWAFVARCQCGGINHI